MKAIFARLGLVLALAAFLSMVAPLAADAQQVPPPQEEELTHAEVFESPVP